MTTQEWDSMTARERDALVAEKLFGLCYHDWILCQGKKMVYTCSKCGKRVRCGGDAHVPNTYATYEGMGLVIEAMREKGYATVMRAIRGWTFCRMFKERLGCGGTVVARNSAPEAVALAALLAVEGEK